MPAFVSVNVEFLGSQDIAAEAIDCFFQLGGALAIYMRSGHPLKVVGMKPEILAAAVRSQLGDRLVCFSGRYFNLDGVNGFESDPSGKRSLRTRGNHLVPFHPATVADFEAAVSRLSAPALIPAAA